MRGVLLDTHALLWWLLDDPQLPEGARRVIGDVETGVLVSSASAWEIATKHRPGKLQEAREAATDLPRLLFASRMEPLPVTVEHALLAGGLPGPHRDPFDRMLIAQARIEGIPVVTPDPVFAAYGVETVW